MSIFDKKVEVKTIEIDNEVVRYKKLTYKFGIYFNIPCPKYLHQALRSRYGSKYGVDVYDDNHLTMTNENGIVEIYNEIQKGKEVFNKYHKGQTVEMHYDGNDFNIVVVKGQYTNFWTYLVNHSKKSVSPIHGYAGHGREFAKKFNYIFNDLY